MAAANTFTNLYASAGVPAQGRPVSSHPGPCDDWVKPTWATIDIDDIGDVKYLIPVLGGKRIQFLDISETTDMDTGGTALDMDIVLRTTDKLGAHTDTILFNAGTFFTAAQTAGAILRVWCDVLVPDSATGMGHIISKVGAAATTPAQGTAYIYASVRSF